MYHVLTFPWKSLNVQSILIDNSTAFYWKVNKNWTFTKYLLNVQLFFIELSTTYWTFNKYLLKVQQLFIELSTTYWTFNDIKNKHSTNMYWQKFQWYIVLGKWHQRIFVECSIDFRNSVCRGILQFDPDFLHCRVVAPRNVVWFWNDFS